jgi:hypothetical protein
MEQKVSESGRCDGVTAKIGDGEPQAGGIPRRRNCLSGHSTKGWCCDPNSSIDERTFALMVGFAQKYDSKAGVGTVVALMLP